MTQYKANIIAVKQWTFPECIQYNMMNVIVHASVQSGQNYPKYDLAHGQMMYKLYTQKRKKKIIIQIIGTIFIEDVCLFSYNYTNGFFICKKIQFTIVNLF